VVLSSGVLSRVSGKRLCVPAPNLRLPSSQGLSRLAYEIWDVMQNQFVDELKRPLIGHHVTWLNYEIMLGTLSQLISV